MSWSLTSTRCASMSNRPSSRCQPSYVTRREWRRWRDGGGSGQGHRRQSRGLAGSAGKRAAAATMRRKRLILRDRRARAATRRDRREIRSDALHPRARPGHDQLARDRVRPRRARSAASAQQEFRQIFPQPGWVEHDADRDLGDAVRRDARGAAPRPASPRATSRPSASPTSARRRVVWERATGTAARATRSSGRTGAPRRSATQLRAAGHAPLIARQDRPRASTRTSPAPSSSGCSTTSPARASARERGELAFGTIDSLARLAADATARRTSPTRRTRAARCSSTSTRGDWDDELLALLDVPRAVLPQRRRRRRASAPRRCSTACACRSPASPATSRRRCSARRASRRAGEEHLRHRLLPAAQHRHAAPSRRSNNLLTTVAWQRGGAIDYALEGSVFIGGAVVQWLRDGLQIIRTASDDRSARRERARQRRRLPRAGVRRARRAALGSVCARRDLRPDARHDAAHIARAALEVDRVPERRCARRDAEGRRHHAHASCASTAARRRTTC